MKYINGWRKLKSLGYIYTISYSTGFPIDSKTVELLVSLKINVFSVRARRELSITREKNKNTDTDTDTVNNYSI